MRVEALCPKSIFTGMETKKEPAARTLNLRSQCPEGAFNVVAVCSAHYPGKPKGRDVTKQAQQEKTARTRRAGKSVEESPVFEGRHSLRT